MRPETRSRVEAAIERLGYRPHTMARNLRLSKHLSIGMIVVDDTPNYLADPFITQVVAGLSNEVNAHGYCLLLQGLSARVFKTSPVVRHTRTDGISSCYPEPMLPDETLLRPCSVWVNRWSFFRKRFGFRRSISVASVRPTVLEDTYWAGRSSRLAHGG